MTKTEALARYLSSVNWSRVDTLMSPLDFWQDRAERLLDWLQNYREPIVWDNTNQRWIYQETGEDVTYRG